LMALLRGGRTVYGQALGILMLDTRFPRPPGDVGNANTWPFPTQYRIVKGADTSRIMGEAPDPTLLEPFLEAARDLEAHGVRAITTSCGFLAVFQRELAAAVSIPVLTSSLLQVPIVSRLLRPDQKVGVLTERPHLTERHFQAVGWSAAEIPVVLESLPPDHERAGAGDGRAGAEDGPRAPGGRGAGAGVHQLRAVQPGDAPCDGLADLRPAHAGDVGNSGTHRPRLRGVAVRIASL
jgi:hypothetical protein